MATLAYETPDGIDEKTIDADHITDSGTVTGVRIRLEDESVLHLPYTRLYWIRMTEDEGRMDYSAP